MANIVLPVDILQIIQDKVLATYREAVLTQLRSVVFPQLCCNRVYLEMQEDSLRYDYTVENKQYYNKIKTLYANEGIIKPFIKIRHHLDKDKLNNCASMEAMRAYGLSYEFYDINHNNLSFELLYSGLDDLVFGSD
jgi:hypothetical protein